jgi:Mrp family chromosome partitioning ATPase
VRSIKVNKQEDVTRETGSNPESSDFETDGPLLHYAPPAMATSMRFFLSRLQRSGAVEGGSTLAITSALAGEGVTSVSRTLAAVLAHDLDRSICLLETNWEDLPPPHESVADDRPGLADVLTSAVPVNSVIVRTSEPRLAFLPAGRLAVADRPVVVASNAFTDVVQMLTKVFDIIVIDAPPVLKASEATTIVRIAEESVLVVRQGVTTEQQLTAAVEELRGTKLLGVIFNRATTKVPKFLQRFTEPV